MSRAFFPISISIQRSKASIDSQNGERWRQTPLNVSNVPRSLNVIRMIPPQSEPRIPNIQIFCLTGSSIVKRLSRKK